MRLAGRLRFSRQQESMTKSFHSSLENLTPIFSLYLIPRRRTNSKRCSWIFYLPYWIRKIVSNNILPGEKVKLINTSKTVYGNKIVYSYNVKNDDGSTSDPQKMGKDLIKATEGRRTPCFMTHWSPSDGWLPYCSQKSLANLFKTFRNGRYTFYPCRFAKEFGSAIPQGRDRIYIEGWDYRWVLFLFFQKVIGII